MTITLEDLYDSIEESLKELKEKGHDSEDTKIKMTSGDTDWNILSIYSADEDNIIWIDIEKK